MPKKKPTIPLKNIHTSSALAYNPPQKLATTFPKVYATLDFIPAWNSESRQSGYSQSASLLAHNRQNYSQRFLFFWIIDVWTYKDVKKIKTVNKNFHFFALYHIFLFYNRSVRQMRISVRQTFSRQADETPEFSGIRLCYHFIPHPYLLSSLVSPK